MIWLALVVALIVVVLTVNQYLIRSKRMDAIDSAASMLRADVVEVQRLAASLVQAKGGEEVSSSIQRDRDPYSVADDQARAAIESVLRFSRPDVGFDELSIKSLNSDISLICENDILADYYADLIEAASYMDQQNFVSVVDDDFWNAEFWSSDKLHHRPRGLLRQGSRRKVGRSHDDGENSLSGYVFS
ncbi:hypothetical protein [Marinobacter nitratireducens]|uniref:hypothetical protein n=1 Tax=Marinobacter nitratireducens TaxID=1137280 RepID=UPI00055C1ECB|nr:hypothetical protein [Marinobacter nitratireducens]